MGFLSTLSLRRATCDRRGPLHDRHISIHALLAESDTETCLIRGIHRTFLSTLSLRRATVACITVICYLADFYPRSPCGERPFQRNISGVRYKDFYPRSPCGERPFGYLYVIEPTAFLSTLSLRRATAYRRCRPHPWRISIHALLAESDMKAGEAAAGEKVFLSTLSLRRATPTARAVRGSVADFYPRSPCGERPEIQCAAFVVT